MICLLSVVCIKRKNVTIIIDGEERKVVTYKSNVKDALQNMKIYLAPKDKIEPALDSKLAKNDTIKIKKALNITVAVDGKNLNIQSAEQDVNSMLKSEGINLNPEDKISPSKETALTKDLKIEVVRVETKTFTESVPINYKTIVKNDNNLPNTQQNTAQEGSNGEKQVTTSITYENNKEVSRKVVSENVVKQAIDKIIIQGTLPILPISRGGDPIGYTKSYTARATAYSPIRGATTAYTASGRKAVRNPNGYSTVAVDPSIVPYGTQMFIEGYGFAIAADCGSGVNGTGLDLFYNTYGEACSWGVKYVKVYILK